MNTSSPATLESIFSNSTVLSYGKDQVIIHADDIPSGIFYIKSGFIKKTALLENGREVTLRVYKAGSYFPLIWAFTNIDNFYYRTVTAVELQKAPRDLFVSFIRNNPNILFELTKQILVNEHELMTNITHQFSGDSYHRVIAALVLCMKRFSVKAKGNALVIKLPLTHQDIADITSLTRETVSLVMIKLKKKKIITSYNHSIIIKNAEGLMKESTINAEQDII